MKAETGNPNHQPGVLNRMLPAVLPVLLISIGYVDPGKWVATVEGGARFGFDLVAPMLLFNCAAILFQYLSARIGIVTGRDLAQICSDEYDKATRIFLGVQAELSMVVLDLTMVLGVAHGINLLLGVDLSTGVFLAALDAVLFPVFATVLDHRRASFLCIYATGFVLLSYLFGVLFSQPEISLTMTGMLTKLSGESAFALMSLLGASIMPHNFYLHSFIVQQHRGPPNISKSALCHSHLFAILCAFSGIYLVNYVLMNSAANVFHSEGLVLVTFQDAMSLMEQVFRNGIVPLIFLLVLFLSNQITASAWNLGGQVVLHDFLGIDLPGWLHRATIRIMAMVPALYCVWTSGAEGIYQLLIFAQVMVALLLPSSVIPLFRIASSRPIMGVYKISPMVEFLALVTFMGMLGLKMVFVVEMIFGNSDWVDNLRLNAGISMSVPFTVLLVTACASFSLMLWLAATPLKSSSSRSEARASKWALKRTVSEAAIERVKNDLCETRYHGEESAACMQERSSTPEKSIESHSDLSFQNYDLDLPETIMEPDREIHMTTVNEKSSDSIFPSPSSCNTQESSSIIDSAPTVFNEVVDDDLPSTKTLRIASTKLVEKTASPERDLLNEKDDDDDGDSWEPEEPSKPPSGSMSSLTLDGPPSFRSLSGKSDDGGNGTGSLSRLAGLGRAARRQLAAILDEFWGQLYDFHGQPTPEAKVKKLDVLLGIDSKPLKVDTTRKEYGGHFPLVGGRGSDAINSSLFESPKQPKAPNNVDSPYGYSRGSLPLWSNHMQLLDAYVQNSSQHIDSSERRYSSLRAAPSVDAVDYQPATVHGYQIASYLNRIVKDKSSDCLNVQMELPASKSPALALTNYRDSQAFALGQKLQNGMTPAQAAGFQNAVVSRNTPLQSERSYYDMNSTGTNGHSGLSVNSKKYHSLPDISGLSVPHRNMYMSDKSAQWDNSIGYGSTIGHTNYQASMYSNTGSRAGVPLTFDPYQLKGYRDSLPLQLSSSPGTGSLWSRQPFEQFGVAEKRQTAGNEALGNGLNSLTQDTASGVDLESKLLQSFRHCIVRLLKLDGSDWLFRQNDGADEDLIDRIAVRERFLYDAEAKQANQVVHMGESRYLSSERSYGSTPKSNGSSFANFSISSVPRCGEGCIWKADLIISFGVWCIHRILDLSLMESRPELWGKYTYVLNRLQGVIDLAFSKHRSPVSPCFCLQIPVENQQKLSPPVSNGSLPPASKPGRGKTTTASTLLDIIKDVEIAISCRKGRTGTASGDIAFPKGKENLASVLKRYKRRLSTKQVGILEGTGSRKVPTTAPMLASYNL